MLQVASQMYPPKAAFTELNVGDLSGKVYVVTGSNTGVGKELAGILYSKNATVFIACRSEDKAREAISWIRAAHPGSTGSLRFLQLDLSDLQSVSAAARALIAQNPGRLDVLINNAGVMHPPEGSTSKQGYELQLAVNNLGHVLFTELLTPLLAGTAAKASANARPNGVRVVWVSSLYAEMSSPKNGFDPDNIDYSKKKENKYVKYSVSKAGVFYQGTEYARRYKDKGIISLTLNPGNLKSDLQRHAGPVLRKLANLTLFPPINGAYTELFAALSPEVTQEHSGSYIIPWGRLASMRNDLERGARPVSEGGTGENDNVMKAKQFMEWEKTTQAHLKLEEAEAWRDTGWLNEISHNTQ